MLLNAYTVFDNKTESYSPPFFQAQHGAAVRMLTDLVNDVNTSIGRHPSDYSLFCIGQFDDQAGFIRPSASREHIVDAISLAAKQRQADFFTDMAGKTSRDPGNVMV